MPRPVETQRQVDARAPRMERLRANRDSVRTIASRLGASKARVFGSVARGDDGPESDVDLLIHLDGQTYGLLPLVAIALLLHPCGTVGRRPWVTKLRGTARGEDGDRADKSRGDALEQYVEFGRELNESTDGGDRL